MSTDSIEDNVFVVPPEFPDADFRAYGVATRPFFPKLLSDEDRNDPVRRLRQFTYAWQAVRYRFRSCVEANTEFRNLFANLSPQWLAGWGDEELAYKLDRTVVQFFMSAMSVFESLGFGLYFFGSVLRPSDFQLTSEPRRIDAKATKDAYLKAFPGAEITQSWSDLLTDQAYKIIRRLRNLLAHRVSGRQNILGWIEPETGFYKQKETWYIPGYDEALTFSELMLQERLDSLTPRLSRLVADARKFAETAELTP